MERASEGKNTVGERIAKAIARAGLCSRREAEAWIAVGRVAVNGALVASPALNVTAADRITVDNEPLPARERTRLFLYHKPRGLVTTHADPQGRSTIFDSLPKDLPRLLSVGRLDLNTEGLVLLTNDGGLERALELPSTGWLRRYRVRAHGRVNPERLAALRGGIAIDGVRYGAIDAHVDREQGANVWLTFAMREGKNREVKNVLGHLGLAVNRLIRISFGPFQLGALPEGAVEEIRTRHLREQLGERIAAIAAADFSAPIAHVGTGLKPVPTGSRRADDRAGARLKPSPAGPRRADDRIRAGWKPATTKPRHANDDGGADLRPPSGKPRAAKERAGARFKPVPTRPRRARRNPPGRARR
jgi:23S rRNA pseudouridine2605 synthase